MRMSRRLPAITAHPRYLYLSSGVVKSGATAAVGACACRGETPTGRRGRPGGLGPAHLGLESLAAAVEVAQLALQVRLESGAVLPLELLELLDVLLQRRALGVQATHGLLVPLAGIAFECVGLRPGLP